LRRVTKEELVFYDRLAERISNLLGSHACALTQSSLAKRIGWNRASLCNFVNRIDKSVAAHFIPRIAGALKVSVEHLMSGQSAPVAERNRWDPRSDDVDLILDKMSELRGRNAHCISLMGIMPLETLPNHAMVANFVDSMLDGASPTAAERWHELIESLREFMKDEGTHNVDYVIPLKDLMKLPRRQPPYQGFSDEEVVHMLDNVKKEWVRQHGMRIIAVEDPALTPDVKLELASNISLTVVGRETQIRCRRDMRTDWDDDPEAVRFSRDCLIRLKRSAGFGVRERPTVQQVEQLIDQLLRSIQANPNRPEIQKRADRASLYSPHEKSVADARQLIA
jgi:hypothetical protein